MTDIGLEATWAMRSSILPVQLAHADSTISCTTSTGNRLDPARNVPWPTREFRSHLPSNGAASNVFIAIFCLCVGFECTAEALPELDFCVPKRRVSSGVLCATARWRARDTAAVRRQAFAAHTALAPLHLTTG